MLLVFNKGDSKKLEMSYLQANTTIYVRSKSLKKVIHNHLVFFTSFTFFQKE